MTRTVLTDDSGRWFDREKAEKFSEDTNWNGSNHISLATGSQWDHQVLFRTKGGLWILHNWSQWQGSTPTYKEIDDEEAARWLVRNNHDDHSVVADKIAELEMQ